MGCKFACDDTCGKDSVPRHHVCLLPCPKQPSFLLRPENKALSLCMESRHRSKGKTDKVTKLEA